MPISKSLVQDQTDSMADIEILHRKGFDVHMRLFIENESYRYIITTIISHMRILLNTFFEDYPKLRGISGANVGIPFNIILVKLDNGKAKSMINPKMTRKSTEMRIVKSNCGSICLDKPVEIERHAWIDVSWYDEDGKEHSERFQGTLGSTIQHEIEHNLGILITDKRG